MGLPHVNSTYKILNPIGKRLLTRLRLGIDHFIENKLRHNFADFVNPLWPCSIKAETTLPFFWHCHNFLKIRRKLFGRIKQVGETPLQ